MMSIDLISKAAERRAIMDGIFVETPRTVQAHESFTFLMEHAKATPHGKLCVLLVAPSQSGKSRVIETFADEHNTAGHLDRLEMPVLHVTLKADVTRKALAQDILLELQKLGVETGPTKGSEAELWERVYVYLAAAKVRILVLDEIHHLKHSSSEHVAYSVGECIKHALLKGPCPVVLSGIKSAELPFLKNDQLRQRAIPPIELKPLSAHSASDLRLFIEFLAKYTVAMEERGVAANATMLIEGDVPECLLTASEGVLGSACRLLKEAIFVMTCAGRDHITRDDLIRATDDAFVRTGMCDSNPFVGARSMMVPA